MLKRLTNVGRDDGSPRLFLMGDADDEMTYVELYHCWKFFIPDSTDFILTRQTIDYRRQSMP